MPDLEAWVLMPLLAASLIDLRKRKIPNSISFPLIFSGFIFHFVKGSVSSGLVGFAVGFFWFFIPYLFAWVGAGDVKLMAGAGLWAGWPGCIALVLASGVSGAIWVLLLAFRREETTGLWLAAAGGPAAIGREVKQGIRAACGKKVPYGATIFLGYAVSIWF